MKTITLFITLWCVPLLLISQGSTDLDKFDPIKPGPDFGIPVKSEIINPHGDKIDPWFCCPVKAAFLNYHDGYDPYFCCPVKAAFLTPHERKRPITINPRYNRPIKAIKTTQHESAIPGPEVTKTSIQQAAGTDRFDPNNVKVVAIEQPHYDRFDPHKVKVVAIEQPHYNKISPKEIDPLFHRATEKPVPIKNGQAAGNRYGGHIDLNVSVSQNYPNPSYGPTAIDVTVEKACNLSMSVINQSGQLVHHDAISATAEGIYKFCIDTGNWSPGLYIYRVTDGSGVVSKKMSVR
jgi:hypothetical protein